MTFQFEALPAEEFAPLFAMSEKELSDNLAVRVTAPDSNAPCRVSLKRATPGEALILANYTHLDVHSPYASRHAVYVREGAETAYPSPGEIPEIMVGNTLALRAFDAGGFIVDREIAEGDVMRPVLERLLALPGVAHVDVHYAGAGCFAARARAVEAR
ncbi:MAG: DUF1203 domain-containing protein [Pseudomonadota bacterium]